MFLRAQDSSWPQARNAGLAQENLQQCIRTQGTIKNELPIISLNQDDVAPKSRSWGERYASNKWHFCKILSLLLLLHNFRELSHFLRAQRFEAAMYFLSGRMKISHTGRGLSEDAWSQMQWTLLSQKLSIRYNTECLICFCWRGRSVKHSNKERQSKSDACQLH